MNDNTLVKERFVFTNESPDYLEKFRKLVSGFFGGSESCEFVRIFTVENRFQADLLKDIFEKERIPVIIESYHDTAYDGLFIPQRGWGSIVTVKGFEDRALAIVKDFLKTYDS